MLDALARLLIGPAADLAAGLKPEIAELGRPGRAAQWRELSAGKCLAFKAQEPRVEPFFNPIKGHTRPKLAS